jgi:predicted metal-dependent HD superfamily phosphohydrolase
MELKATLIYWNEVIEHFNLPSEKANNCLKNLIDLLSQENRYYHNLEHVLHLLNLIDGQNLSRENRICLILTAFYHDAVYSATSKNNELESAKLLLKDFGGLETQNFLVTAAARIIFDTQFHESNDPLSQLFFDMDLSILGTDEVSYEIYTKQIRQEYSAIPKLLYRKGRKEFIKYTIEKKSIYQTKQFINEFENQAIENLNRELKSL